MSSALRNGEWRSILHGSPKHIATSSKPSRLGRSQRGPARTSWGRRRVTTIAPTTVTAIGQRGSPVTPTRCSAALVGPSGDLGGSMFRAVTTLRASGPGISARRRFGGIGQIGGNRPSQLRWATSDSERPAGGRCWSQGGDERRRPPNRALLLSPRSKRVRPGSARLHFFSRPRRPRYRKDGMSGRGVAGRLKGCRPSASKDIRRRHARIAPARPVVRTRRADRDPRYAMGRAERCPRQVRREER